MHRIDINCDMGESFGAYRLGSDEAILPFVTSVNIACGFHAGDPTVMRRTVAAALERGAAIGAHPGLPDLAGFGRRNLDITPEEAYDMVVYQVGALYGFVTAAGGQMQHVKPHGALYNMAASDYALAEAIARAVHDLNPELVLFGLSGSELIKAGQAVGLRCAHEVFADRTYQRDSSLTPRREANALITDTEEAVQQVIRMVKEGVVYAVQGIDVAIQADTVCIHGDGAHAFAFAQSLRQRLSEEGIVMQSVLAK
ncbi:LamB/YcsF family protein [Paenibacillus alvei]|uniref:LamB/YcsF family protein n=1 Tax=Paenibacillus alvei TaxID=44250 RepID=UPI0018CF2601|nr:5-oxoprolinase subunit PxpA [Paenibacillus alvei]MBG9737337.1 LamB/YcsF family protein [Paenibacillus alvei]MBG9746120.1 LamB/YcsF family protein [Paenibacillus alvei]MCY9579133.1 LamB/YcsF family protein [Paenibacillus alvei]MCY9583560.1 LamB/YcsF family protein [Paenibacillus alvei]